jgi:CTP synthase (UTP-ammonia lyase)
MKTLSASLLALTLGAGPVLAEAHMDRENMVRSRDITGGEVYSMAEETMWDDDTMYDTVDTNWNDIGEIEDVVMDRNGQMIGVIAEVGGFLDIGDKHVMLPLENVRLVPVDDRSYSIVTDMTEEQLEELPEMDEGFWN